MSNFFDSFSRRLAHNISRREALKATGALATMVLAKGCDNPLSPNSNKTTTTKHCTTAPYTAYCEAAGVCCKPDYPHYCSNTKQCYQFFTQAQQACGNSYEICGNG